MTDSPAASWFGAALVTSGERVQCKTLGINRIASPEAALTVWKRERSSEKFGTLKTLATGSDTHTHTCLLRAGML